MSETRLPEPWLRGTHLEVPHVQRAVLHALELADEDLRKWCGHLSNEQINSRPFGLASVAFHIQHIARSIDRLLTYAEAKELSAAQSASLKTEIEPGATRDAIFRELAEALGKGAARIRGFSMDQLNDSRNVGRNRLPTTFGGLLVHIADHTQRHVGQAITTAKAVLAQW